MATNWAGTGLPAGTSCTTVIERATVDTNILIYSIDAAEGHKHGVARRIVDALSDAGAVIPLQALNEFYFVCSRKRKMPVQEAQAFNRSLMKRLKVVGPSPEDLADAMQIHQQGAMQFFDALLVATAARAGCAVLLSEDMQHGYSTGGLTIVNPFALSEPELDQLLS
ncbi:PIN domain-containing protein [Granulicella sp. WH15]|uniref:PIN domain-containing protein n=1 Tax=Granulicella sp. WH15 TaxID=2602070 RepID=UPI0013A5ADC1|nr:PIN domain-containing protein [Granulicella sp. WH15]